MKYYLFIFCLVLPLIINGQNIPAYNQFNTYQYLYNPAALGSYSTPNVNLMFRQQWANLSGAPRFGHLGLVLPLSQKSAIGINLSNFERGILTTTSAMSSYAYTLRLGRASFLSMGMSIGAERTGIDTEQITDFSDPVLANALDASFSLKGQAGIMLKVYDLSLHLSLPKLFKSDPISTEDFQEVGFEALENAVGGLSYSIQISPDFAFEPMAFAYYSSSTNSIYKGFGTFYYKNTLWIGGSYEYELGPAVFGGLSINDILTLGYSYEFQSNDIGEFANGSHEVLLRLNLGKKKFDRYQSTKRTEPTPTTAAKQNEPESEETNPPIEEKAVKEKPAEKEIPVIVEEKVEEIPVKEQNEVEKEPVREEREPVIENPQPEVKPEEQEVRSKPTITYIVVIGSFDNRENAEKYLKQVQTAGYSPQMWFNEKNSRYYIHLYKGEDKNAAIKYRTEIRSIQQFQFSDAWIYQMN